jgi:hypothetical protein
MELLANAEEIDMAAEQIVLDAEKTQETKAAKICMLQKLRMNATSRLELIMNGVI